MALSSTLTEIEAEKQAGTGVATPNLTIADWGLANGDEQSPANSVAANTTTATSQEDPNITGTFDADSNSSVATNVTNTINPITPTDFGEFNPANLSANAMLINDGNNNNASDKQPVTVFDQPIVEKRAELDRLIEQREQDSRRLVLATGQAASGEGISFPLEDADRIVLEAMYREFEQLVDNYREERRREIAAQPGGERKLETLSFDTEEDYRAEISVLFDIATQPKYNSLPLIKAFLNNPNFQILAEAEQYRLKQKNELDFFAGFGLSTNNSLQPSPIDGISTTEVASEEIVNQTGSNDTVTTGVVASRSRTQRPATATRSNSNAITTVVTNSNPNEETGAQAAPLAALQAFVEEAQRLPFSVALSKLIQVKTVATRLQTQYPDAPDQLEISLPRLPIAYYVNQFLHEPLNKRARPVSQLLAKNVALGVLIAVFILFSVVSFIFIAANNSNSDSGKTPISNKLPDVIVQMVGVAVTPSPTVNANNVTVVANNNNSTTIIAPTTVVVATVSPTPTAPIEQLPSSDPHGNFSAPSTMQIPALSLSAPVGKAEVMQDGNQVTVLWPSGTNKDHPAQYGAYPGEQGNMVIIGDWKALGVATQLQVNDLIQITNRNGTLYTYQVMPLGDNDEPQAIVGCGNHDFLAGQQIATDSSNNGLTTVNKAVKGLANADSYLTLVIPYVDDSQNTNSGNSNNTTSNSSSNGNNGGGLTVNLTPTATVVNSGSNTAVAASNATTSTTPVKCTPLGQDFPAGTSPQTTGDPRYLVRVWRAKIVAVAPKPAPTIGTPVVVAIPPTPTPTKGSNPTSPSNGGHS